MRISGPDVRAAPVSAYDPDVSQCPSPEGLGPLAACRPQLLTRRLSRPPTSCVCLCGAAPATSVTETVTLTDRDRGSRFPRAEMQKDCLLRIQLVFVLVPYSRVFHTSHQRAGKPLRFRIVTIWRGSRHILKDFGGPVHTSFRGLLDTSSRQPFLLLVISPSHTMFSRFLRVLR
jgi:hypothetical protein